MLPSSGMKNETATETPPKPSAQHSVTTAALLATWRTMRRLFILIIGLTVLLISVVLFIVPGSTLAIPLGLAILGIEFAWARRWLAKFKSYLPKRKVKTEAALSQPAQIPQESAPLLPRSSSAETASAVASAAPH